MRTHAGGQMRVQRLRLGAVAEMEDLLLDALLHV